VIERYLGFVYSSAYRRTGSAQLATEATRAVFLVLARRARWLKTKTVLAGWLFQVTSVTCRKIGVKPRRAGWRRWFGGRPKSALPADSPLWLRVAPELDEAIKRLPLKQREAVLLSALLGEDRASVARILRTSEHRVGKHVDRGMKKLAGLLRQDGVTATALAQVCREESCAAPMPEGLAAAILASLDQSLDRRPALRLAQRTLNALAWARWRKLAIGAPALVLLLATLAAVGWHHGSRTGHSWLISTFLVWSVKNEARRTPGMTEPARPWPPASSSGSRPDAAQVHAARDLYQTTNIWLAHVKFTGEQWSEAQPKRIDPLPHFFQPDGTVLLRHPEAQRNGLAGVLGFDFHWTQGDLDFSGVSFTNVAVRIKGNGTYLGSLYGDKCPFKVDLNRFTKGQKIGGADELTFNNLVNDYSCLSDALAYEFFRDAGVPASRTAYAYLSSSVEGQWERKPLGLYLMVEAVDEDFVLEHFGSRRTPVFKPVTYELFKHLGDDWAAFEAIYDLKTKATPEQLRRVIEFARVVTHAGDTEFGRQLGDFLDLEMFARYLASEVLLSNYDGFLSNGQNFYLYLHHGSNKFGFIPWDLDLSWGGFFLLGTAKERERASIWHPWVGRHRFLERVMAVEAFRKLYRAQLEDQLATHFIPGRLRERIDAVATVVRGPIAAESDFRLAKFEQAVSDQRQERPPKGDPQGAGRPAHQLKLFVEARVRSVREQLDGKSDGVILRRGGRK
jgi:DNA-directed RNA polymerase specialized sigma24 family protein